MYEAVPGALRFVDQWILWRAVPRGEGIKLDKVPSDPASGKRISAHEPENWLTFDDAVEALKDRTDEPWGIGFVITREDPFCCVDLDDCAVDGDVDSISSFALRTIETLIAPDTLDANVYVEWSPSRNGLHVWVAGEWRGARKRGSSDEGDDWEVYDSRQFLTITGDVGPHSSNEISSTQDQLDKLAAEISPGAPQGSRGSPQSDASLDCDVTVESNEGPPEGRLRDLKDSHELAAATWERKRGGKSDDWQDQSASSYCFALAQYMLRVGWTDQQICDALVYWREKHGEDLKLDRRDNWYARTISRARAYLDAPTPEEQRTRAQQLLEKEDDDAKNSQSASDEEKIESLEKLFGVQIISIVKYLADPAVYYMSAKLLRGRNSGQVRKVEIGTAYAIQGQTAFLSALIDATGRVVKKVNPDRWVARAQAIIDVAEEVEVGDGTNDGKLACALEVYLMRRVPEQRTVERLVEKLPVLDKGDCYFHATTFLQFAQRGDLPLPKSPYVALRQARFVDKSFSTGKSSVTYWRVPDALWQRIALFIEARG